MNCRDEPFVTTPVNPREEPTLGTYVPEPPWRGAYTARMQQRVFIVFIPLFLSACAATPASPPSGGAAPASAEQRAAVDVVELSATEARDRMTAGALTSRALTQAYLDRIA